MSFFKNLIKSKTIQGIVIAAVGAAIPAAKIVFPQYAGAIDAAAALLSASGLSYAVYGRTVAQGPITSDTPYLK